MIISRICKGAELRSVGGDVWETSAGAVVDATTGPDVGYGGGIVGCGVVRQVGILHSHEIRVYVELIGRKYIRVRQSKSLSRTFGIPAAKSTLAGEGM